MKRIKRLKISITISVLVRLQHAVHFYISTLQTTISVMFLFPQHKFITKIIVYPLSEVVKFTIVYHTVQQLLTVLHTCMTMNKHVQQL